MKKALGLVLAIVMVLGLAIPASAAVSSPAGSEEDLKPFLITADSDEYGIATAEEVSELPEEVQEVFAEAKENLEEAVPEEMVVRYFFYFYTNEPCDAVFRIEGYQELVFMQFIDGEWVELEFTINADGTVTVLNVVDAPMAIFVKKA